MWKYRKCSWSSAANCLFEMKKHFEWIWKMKGQMLFIVLFPLKKIRPISTQFAGQPENLKPVTAVYLWSLSVLPTIVLDVALACSVWTARLRSYVSSEKQLVCVDWQLIALWFNLVRDFQKCCVHSDLEIGAPHSLCVQNFNAPKKRDKGPPWWCHSPVSKQALAAGEGPGQDILWPSLPRHHPPLSTMAPAPHPDPLWTNVLTPGVKFKTEIWVGQA